MTQTLDQTLNKDPIRALIYSPSGGGKTTLAGLAALHDELRPIYFFDWDLRIASLQSIIPKEVWTYIHSDPYRDDLVSGSAFTMMMAKLEKLEKEGFKTVVVDSLTFAMTGIMNRVLALDGNKPGSAVPQLQNYNNQKSLATDFISRLCSKNFNVIVTCHEDTDKDEVTGRMFKSLDLTGKLAGKMPGYFNEFWHCEVQQLTGKEPAYVVRTRGDMIYAARTSYKLEAIEPQALIWGKIIAQRKALAQEVYAPNDLRAPSTDLSDERLWGNITGLIKR